MSIVILPEGLINKIAAGEVIERPASVVKELVENALDAGATRVEVELEGGGATLIRVIDNGHGIEADDLALAFVSHATSKLKEEDDLFNISTMGFRGEALSSIGAVSQARIVSRTARSDVGYEVEMNGGVIGTVKACGAPVGTRVEVRNLFYNVPVRRKFLKSTATEMAHISEAITRIALAWPAVQFVLTHNGRSVFNLPPAGDRGQRIGEFFGRRIAENLIPFSETREQLGLEGYLLPPAIDRSTTTMQYTYVNSRYVRDRSLTHAIAEAYKGLMLPQRKPVCFLFLAIDPREVDVNVHPTKVEVKFRRAREIHNQVLHVLKSVLRQARLIPQVSISTDVPEATGRAQETKEAVQQAVWDFFGKGAGRGEQAPLAPRRQPPQAPSAAAAPAERVRVGFGNCVQVLDSYIVEERPDGLNLIDQHALHERLLYNEMKKRLAEGPLNSQRLLIPELVELPKQEFYALLELREELARFGIAMEPFGDRTVIVRSFPQVLRDFDARSFFQDLLDELQAPEGLSRTEERFEKLLKIVSCRGAVKAGQRLAPAQIKELLERRAADQHTDTCPHGRPTTIFLSRAELEKQFKRT